MFVGSYSENRAGTGWNLDKEGHRHHEAGRHGGAEGRGLRLVVPLASSRVIYVLSYITVTERERRGAKPLVGRRSSL